MEREAIGGESGGEEANPNWEIGGDWEVVEECVMERKLQKMLDRDCR
jgi:hypothetical protein